MTPAERQQVDALDCMHDSVKKVRTFVRTKWSTTLFAIRYFNQDNEELAYYCPNLQPQGSLVVFEPPRKWSAFSLAQIGL
jgi:hypothetical protein